MADLEFFFDPVCPWAWITSRWVTEVQAAAHYEVNWRFIWLKMINEDRTDDWYTPEYRAGHMAGLYGLRVADQVRLEHGNDAVGALYTALGEFDPRRGSPARDHRRPGGGPASVLKSADLPPGVADAALDESHDAYIRTETELAFERTGKDVGTPIITFHPGQPTRPASSARSSPRSRAARRAEVVGRRRDRRHDQRHGRAEALEPSKPVFD